MTLGLTRRSSWRIEARSSTSSTKTTAAGSSSSSSKVSASSFACRSAPSAPISDGETSKNGQPSREAMPFANVVLPGAGRAEEDDRLRLHDAVAAGELGLGERQDHAPLDDLLRLVHAAQLVPEPRIDHPAAELRDRSVGARARQRALVDVEPGRRVAAPGECRAFLRHDHDALHAPVCEHGLDSVDEPRLRLVVLGDDDADPAGAARGRTGGDADERAAVLGHHRHRALVRQQHQQPLDRLAALGRALQQPQRAGEITVLVGANRSFHPRTILGRSTGTTGPTRQTPRASRSGKPDYPGTAMKVILPDATELRASRRLERARRRPRDRAEARRAGRARQGRRGAAGSAAAARGRRQACRS